MQKLFPSKQSLRWFEVKDKLYAVLWITFFWLLLAVYQYTDRYATLVTNACVDPDYQHGPHIRGLIITIALAGLFVATGLFQTPICVQPKFKAGLHYGPVIAGEMGIIKREIVYSGDVLNTASRIQSLCNEMKTDILISKHLIDQVDTMFMAKKKKSLGIIDLRGKQEKVELVTLLNPN